MIKVYFLPLYVHMGHKLYIHTVQLSSCPCGFHPGIWAHEGGSI